MTDYGDLAIDILRDWLLDQWENADFFEVIQNDPDGVLLLDDEFEKVLGAMKKLKVNINIQ